MSVQGVTFDTAVLVALERCKPRAWEVFRRVRERKALVSVPAPVVGEWRRGRTDVRDAIRQAARVEPLTDTIQVRAPKTFHRAAAGAKLIVSGWPQAHVRDLLITNKNTYDCDTGATGSCKVSGLTNEYDDGTDIFVVVSKRDANGCRAADAREKVSYTVTGHL